MADGLTGPDLGALLRELKAVDAKATTLLRRNIRNAAKVAADASKREVQKPSPQGGRGSRITREGKRRGSYTFEEDGETVTERYTETFTERTTVRAEIARGIAVRLGNSQRHGASVRVVGSSQHLPSNRKAMLRLYNKTSWRHPVFGGKEWVSQLGRPFFGEVLDKYRDDVQRAIQAAVDEANAALLRAK